MSSINPISSRPQGSTPALKQASKTSFRAKLNEPSRLDHAIRSIHKDEEQINRAIARAGRGADFDQVELLKLQALTYRYSEKVNVASKIVAQATSGIKQILNTQV